MAASAGDRADGTASAAPRRAPTTCRSAGGRARSSARAARARRARQTSARARRDGARRTTSTRRPRRRRRTVPRRAGARTGTTPASAATASSPRSTTARAARVQYIARARATSTIAEPAALPLRLHRLERQPLRAPGHRLQGVRAHGVDRGALGSADDAERDAPPRTDDRRRASSRAVPSAIAATRAFARSTTERQASFFLTGGLVAVHATAAAATRSGTRSSAARSYGTSGAAHPALVRSAERARRRAAADGQRGRARRRAALPGARGRARSSSSRAARAGCGASARRRRARAPVPRRVLPPDRRAPADHAHRGRAHPAAAEPERAGRRADRGSVARVRLPARSPPAARSSSTIPSSPPGRATRSTTCARSRSRAPP